MRSTMAWANSRKDLDRPQDELSKDLISRSGRIRKIKDVSRDFFVGRNRVTTATATKTMLEDSQCVRVEAVAAPTETVEETSQQEPVKENKSRVNVDLLQKVLTESVEEWFSFTEVVKNNKGKPYKKRKIVLPSLDESDFCFELTETKDIAKNPKDGEDKILDSTSDKQPETGYSEEREKEDIEDAVIKKDSKTTDKSKRAVDEVVRKKQHKRAEKENTEVMKETSKPGEGSEKEKEKEKVTENGINKSFRHFFALILYGDQINGGTEPGMTTADSSLAVSSQQAKTVIKTLDLETADLKEFEVELGDFCKLPKDSPLFEAMNGIERLLHTGSTLRKSLSSESLNVFPQSEKEGLKKSAEMPVTLPSRQKKMNLKARECFFVLRKDIIEKYKRKAEYGMNEEAQKLNEKTSKAVKADELRTEDLKEKAVNKAERKQKPKTNERGQAKTETNGLIEEKVEAGIENPEAKVLTEKTSPKKKGLMMKKEMESEKDNRMSGLKFKRRKRCVRTRDEQQLFSYVNKVKQKSGYRSNSESAESHTVANEEPTAQETRVNEEKETEPKTKREEVVEKPEVIKERRKSQREIKLTPKLVHMIATSHKRARRSPSVREDSGYDYPNLINKVVSGSATPEVVESPPSESAIENYLQSKIEANASSFECSWQPGDLVWARFAGSPFWPSLILKDPFSNDEYTKVKYFGRLLKTYVHLQFLADSGRRAWVPEVYIMSFNGLDEFEKMKSNLPEIDAFTKRNDLMYQKAFFPTKKIEKTWLDAVKEGDILRTKSKDERIDYMKSRYPLVKYAETVTNGELVCNGTTSGESKKLPQLRSRKRKTRCSSLIESSDWANSEGAVTAEEALTNTNETFECVRPADAENNRKGDESEAPKITLKFVRSPKKEETKRWTRSSGATEGQSNKRPKKDDVQDKDAGADSLKTGGGRAEPEEVYQVCLKMVDNEKVVKCNGVCSGLFRKSCRKTARAGLSGVEEGGGPAAASQKKRKRRRKFSSPHVNRWKEKLWAIFDFYNEFGGCKREGMDMRALVALYRSLCDSKTRSKRRSAKLRKIK